MKTSGFPFNLTIHRRSFPRSLQTETQPEPIRQQLLLHAKGTTPNQPTSTRSQPKQSLETVTGGIYEACGLIQLQCISAQWDERCKITQNFHKITTDRNIGNQNKNQVEESISPSPLIICEMLPFGSFNRSQSDHREPLQISLISIKAMFLALQYSALCAVHHTEES